ELEVQAIIGAEITFSAAAAPHIESSAAAAPHMESSAAAAPRMGFSAGASTPDFSRTKEEQHIRARGAAENSAAGASGRRPAENTVHHIVLLAENRTGYGNLSTLITLGRMNHTRGEPSVDLDMLARHADGLFALTGCPRGGVPSLAAAGNVNAACEATAMLLDIFDRRVAVECWDHGLPEERETSQRLMTVAGALDIP